jgi:hypothetical protein
MLQSILAVSYGLFKRADDPLYKGLGLGLFLATFSCMVANLFGDRWTYVEITGVLWVLVAAAIRATDFAQEPEVTLAKANTSAEQSHGVPVFANANADLWKEHQAKFNPSKVKGS